MLRKLQQPTVRQNHLTQSLFYSTMLHVSCDLLNTILKVKDRMTVWVQNGCKWGSGSPSWAQPGWELQASWEGIVLHSTSPRKDQKSKLEICHLLNPYPFYTIWSWHIVIQTIVKSGAISSMLVLPYLQRDDTA